MRRGEYQLRRATLQLILIVIHALLVFSSTSLTNHAFALSGTGVGIRKDGPEYAQVGDIVPYNITVFNLGDYWIRNATVIDTFPNGTSSFWVIPDLAPLNQSGNSFSISEILYTIRERDLINGPLIYIQNHAEVSGFSDTAVAGLSVLVQAETNYPTVIESPLVGGYSVAIKPAVFSTYVPPHIAPYIALLSVITAVFSVFKHKTARASVVHRQHTKKLASSSESANLNMV